MKLLATILVLSLPAVYSAARYHSSISFFAARTLTLGPRLPAILSDSASAPALNDSSHETEKSSEPTTTSHSAARFHFSFSFSPIRYLSLGFRLQTIQSDSTNASALTELDDETNMKRKSTATLYKAASYGLASAIQFDLKYCGGGRAPRNTSQNLPFGASDIDISSLRSHFSAFGNGLPINFGVRRWDDAGIASLRSTPANSPFKHPAKRKPPDLEPRKEYQSRLH